MSNTESDSVIQEDEVTYDPDYEDREFSQLVWFCSEATDDDVFDRFSMYSFKPDVDYVELFEDMEKCRQYLYDTQQSIKTTFLICSRQQKELVSLVHQLPHISKIYIHDPNEENDHTWMLEYPKVGTSLIFAANTHLSHTGASHCI